MVVIATIGAFIVTVFTVLLLIFGVIMVVAAGVAVGLWLYDGFF